MLMVWDRAPRWGKAGSKEDPHPSNNTALFPWPGTHPQTPVLCSGRKQALRSLPQPLVGMNSSRTHSGTYLPGGPTSLNRNATRPGLGVAPHGVQEIPCP